jgi:hypothetical protein
LWKCDSVGFMWFILGPELHQQSLLTFCFREGKKGAHLALESWNQTRTLSTKLRDENHLLFIVD